MKSIRNKALFIQAVLGGILITALLLPFQALTPYAPYTWMVFIPIAILFSLGANIKVIPSMFISYIFGIVWGELFFFSADLLSSFLSMELIFALLTTVIIFLILQLPQTPLGYNRATLDGYSLR